VVDRKALLRIARIVLEDEDVARSTVGVVLVGNDEMRGINNQSLGHDYPTDVISFSYGAEAVEERVGTRRRGSGLALEGDIVLGAEYAAEMAPEYGWSVGEELSLYLAHGLLHLCGYDDLTPSEKRIMRRREREVLRLAGLTPPYRRRRDGKTARF
jgi:probable rRNA maturation factor